MSASICWEPVSDKKMPLGIMCPSHFIKTLGKVFGELPLQLSEDDIPRLRVIAQLDESEDFCLLIETIEKYGKIRIYAEY